MEITQIIQRLNQQSKAECQIPQASFSCVKFATWLFCVLLLSACGGELAPEDDQNPDPVVVDVPIAYIKRDLTDPDVTGIRSLEDPALFQPGASLVIKARANTSAQEVDITSSLFADLLDADGNPLPYDVKDLESDYTGTKLIFSMRAPMPEDTAEEPTWNIWEYDRQTETLRRIIQSDLVAESGHDTGPTYLADGRIVFSSTRQRGNLARLLDENKPQYAGLEESRRFPASVLHVMNADGTEIKQISFNQSHDFDPVILPNGKVLFSRWDQVERNKGIHLYQMNPDGSDLEILYGRHSHQSIENLDNLQYAATSITPEGKILAAITSFDQSRLVNDYLAIDTENYIDNTTPVASMPSLTGPAQQSALFDNIDLFSDISPGGYIAALYPLWDGSGRILFSWEQCRLLAPLPQGAASGTERSIAPCSEENLADDSYDVAPSLYGLWMYRPPKEDSEATQLPLNVATLDSVVTEIVAMENRAFPANPSSTVDTTQQQLIDEKYGVLHIKSVYDLDGEDTSPNGIVNMANPEAVAVADRPARFLRVVKSVSVPDRNTLIFRNIYFGRSSRQLFREIVGYTPIQPDGSVKVAIPANVPFAISILDANGKRISNRHNNWLQLVPGEQKNCVSCHSTNSELPHGRTAAQPESINSGAATTGVPFPNTNPELFADTGESMAETYARVRGIPKLTPNIEFEDVWTDPDRQQPAESFEYRYQDLQTPLPISQNCAQTWTTLCRAVINFPDHIQPIFEADRQSFDDEMNLIADNTCISCHSPFDENNNLRVPEGQLNLISDPSPDAQRLMTSYRELMFPDNQQELIEGALLDRVVQVIDGDGNPVFLVDDDGELILDADGNPIPVTRTVRVPQSMFVTGAIRSARFFDKFNPGESHEGMLSEAELKLIAEWLDIGGQYYNNPFDAPQN